MCDDGGGQDQSAGLEGGGSQEPRGVNLSIRFYATKQKAAMKQDKVTWKMLHIKKVVTGFCPTSPAVSQMCYQSWTAEGSVTPELRFS